MGDKTQGGEVKKTLVKNNFGTNSNDWCDSRVKKKTESRMLMLISQQPCGKVVIARVRKLRLAQGQARQTKSNKENRLL